MSLVKQILQLSGATEGEIMRLAKNPNGPRQFKTDLTELRKALLAVLELLCKQKTADGARDAGTNLTGVRAAVQCTLNQLDRDVSVDDGKLTFHSIDMAKMACEAIADLAGDAFDNGDEPYSKTLGDIVFPLSRVVAQHIPEAQM
jgi:hypothetical protein